MTERVPPPEGEPEARITQDSNGSSIALQGERLESREEDPTNLVDEDMPRSRAAILRVVGIVSAMALAALALRHPALREHLQEERLIQTIDSFRSYPFSVPLLILGFALLACLGSPVTLLMLVTGAVYGVFPGALYALIASLISAAATFTLVKTLGKGLKLDRLGNVQRRVKRQLNRSGFWNLVSFRYIPIPYAIANSILALTGVRLSLVLLTTAVAMLPTSFAWTYFAGSIIGATEAGRADAIKKIGIGLVVLLLLSLLPEVLRRRRRVKRLRALRDHRQDR